MDLFFEGRPLIYGGLIFGWAGLFLIWTFAKFNHFITATLAIAFLLASYWILDTLVVTDKENAELVLADISKQTKQGLIISALKHLDERFITARGTDLKTFESWLTRHQAEKLIKEIIFWDIENIGKGSDKITTKISCMVKVKGSWGGFEEAIYRVEFLFQSNKNQPPTILSFQIYDPINQNNQLQIGI
jgi:hypothetical protein